LNAAQKEGGSDGWSIGSKMAAGGGHLGGRLCREKPSPKSAREKRNREGRKKEDPGPQNTPATQKARKELWISSGLHNTRGRGRGGMIER